MPLLLLLLIWAGMTVGCLTPASCQTSPETPLQSRQPSYVMDTARPAAQINADYPHDIQLLHPSGDTVSSAEVLPTGKPVMLLFWLTTCYPCRMELEALAKVWPQWKDSLDFELVAISTDFARNYPAFLERVAEQQWPWPAYVDLNREFSRILPGGLNGLPQTFFLDAGGQIRGHKRKFRPGDEAELFRMLQEAARSE
jgi:cytochrome c biogenesis protein CcmG, thiol:disulfide interchange protein DsbE